jgi:hypothetical protein
MRFLPVRLFSNQEKMMAQTKGSKNKPKTDTATVKEKADKAEKTAETRAKTKTRTIPPKPPKSAPIAQRYNSPIDEESKALFLQTLPKIADLKGKIARATADLRNAYKTAKKDGFTKNDFDVAFALQQAEGEKAKKAAIARDLTIAKWLGCDLGSQLDLFAQDERVPAVDRAYSEGERDSLQGVAAKPDYDPSTEQYRSYMKGFHDASEKRVKAGIQPLEEKTEKAEEISPPTSGVPLTRSQFRAQQAAALKEKQEQLRGTAEEAPADEEEEDAEASPMFTKRTEATTAH